VQLPKGQLAIEPKWHTAARINEALDKKKNFQKKEKRKKPTSDTSSLLDHFTALSNFGRHSGTLRHIYLPEKKN
jgi:hypothetical protein